MEKVVGTWVVDFDVFAVEVEARDREEAQERAIEELEEMGAVIPAIQRIVRLDA